MADRTLSLYSAGKTFSITGWKIGWAISPENLIQSLQICQQWVVYSVATPLQAAVAHCLDTAHKHYLDYNSYYEWLKHDYESKRNFLWDALNNAGLAPLQTEGSFFIPVDLSKVPLRFSTEFPKEYEQFAQSHQIAWDPLTRQRQDYNFCRQLSRHYKVKPIPFSAFSAPLKTQTHSQDAAPPLARFAFCKPLDQLATASQRLG